MKIDMEPISYNYESFRMISTYKRLFDNINDLIYHYDEIDDFEKLNALNELFRYDFSKDEYLKLSSIDNSIRFCNPKEEYSHIKYDENNARVVLDLIESSISKKEMYSKIRKKIEDLIIDLRNYYIFVVDTDDVLRVNEHKEVGEMLDKYLVLYNSNKKK